MKHLIRTIGCMAWLLLFAVIPSEKAAADIAGNELFSVQISDGYKKTLIPVYETVENGTASLTAETTALTVNTAGKKVKAKIKNKTAYFTAHYTKASVTKKVSLSTGASKALNVKVTAADGSAVTTAITVTRPSKPAVTAVTPKTKSFTIGKKLAFTVNTRTSVPVTLTMKVSSGSKTVLKQKVGTGTDENQTFTWYWDGKNSSGKAVSAGTYKVTAYLKYAYGKKTKTVKKSTTVTAKKASASDTADTAAVTEFTKTWDWIVMITGNNTVDYLAEYICQQVLEPGMSEIERARALFSYCSEHYSTIRKNTWSAAKKAGASTKIDVTSSAAKARIKAYGAVLKQMKAAGTAVKKTGGSVSFKANNTKTAMAREAGDCLNMARMYQALCRHAGLDSDILYNPGYPHFWNTVQIAGVWYECDAHLGYLRQEGFVHFLRGTTFMETVNLKEGNNADDVKRYGTISSNAKYQAVYSTVSKTDCPGR